MVYTCRVPSQRRDQNCPPHVFSYGSAVAAAVLSTPCRRLCTGSRWCIVSGLALLRSMQTCFALSFDQQRPARQSFCSLSVQQQLHDTNVSVSSWQQSQHMPH